MSKFDWEIVEVNGATRMHCSTIDALSKASGISVLDLYSLEEERSYLTHGDLIGCRVVRVRRGPTKSEAKRILEVESPCRECQYMKDNDLCSKNWLTCADFSEWVGSHLSAFRTLHGCEGQTNINR